MKTAKELRAVLEAQEFIRVDAHVHTHLCDGAEDMTAANIAAAARAKGLSCVILTPHFHKKLQDETAVLYGDTDEAILLALREEIEAETRRNGDLVILLSCEADILDPDGDTSLSLTAAGEAALDLVTPTVNFHPLLPLKAVEVTYGKKIAEMHASGLYAAYAEEAGGIEYVLETLYRTEAAAILRSPYPAILGHFFAAHSFVGPYNWFGAKEEHLPIMRRGAAAVVDACVRANALIDLTGIHPKTLTDAEKQAQDGFFLGFQKEFLALCREKGVLTRPGSDAHRLTSVGAVSYYRTFENAVRRS